MVNVVLWPLTVEDKVVPLQVVHTGMGDVPRHLNLAISVGQLVLLPLQFWGNKQVIDIHQRVVFVHVVFCIRRPTPVVTSGCIGTGSVLIWMRLIIIFITSISGLKSFSLLELAEQLSLLPLESAELSVLPPWLSFLSLSLPASAANRLCFV